MHIPRENETASPPPTIDTDVFCRRCGYRLRGLAETEPCPECSLPVAASVRGDDRLDYAEPRWVATLSRSTVWLLVWWIGAIPLLVVSGTIYTSSSVGPFAYFVDAVVALLALIALWLAATPDPGRRVDVANVALRALAVAGLVSVVFDFALDIWDFPYSEQVFLASGVLDAAQVALLFVILMRLARRLRNGERLERTSRLLIWGNLIPYLILIGVGIPLMVLGAQGAVPASEIGAAQIAVLVFLPLGCASGIAMLVFWVWSLITFVRFRVAFSAAAEQAAANWSAS